MLAAAALPLPAMAQASLATGSAPEVPWLRLVLSFALCIGLAFAAILLLRRYQRQGSAGLLASLRGKADSLPAPEIKVLESRRLGPSGQICLVEFDGRKLLLSVTNSEIAILAEKQPDTSEESDS